MVQTYEVCFLVFFVLIYTDEALGYSEISSDSIAEEENLCSHFPNTDPKCVSLMKIALAPYC